MRWITGELLALSVALGCGSTADSDQAQYPQQPQYEAQMAPQTYQPPAPAQTYQYPQQPQTYEPPGHPHLGVALQAMTGELRSYFGASPDRGVLVTRVMPDSIAQQAGLQVGDVITFVGNRLIQTTDDVRRALAERADATVDIQVIRRATPVMVRVTLTPRPADQPPNPTL